MSNSSFSYTDHEFNQMYIEAMEECISVMRQRSLEYNNAAESHSMMTYLNGDEIIAGPFQVCYMYIMHKAERFKNCLAKYIKQLSIGTTNEFTYEKTEDSLRDLVNYAVFELVILRLHHKHVLSQVARAEEVEVCQ